MRYVLSHTRCRKIVDLIHENVHVIAIVLSANPVWRKIRGMASQLWIAA